MALSDCPKCWDTPCRCGFEYQHFTTDELIKLIKALVQLLEEKL